MKKAWLILLCFAAASVLAAAEGATTFNWAFVKRTAGGAASPIVFSERVGIAAGDLFKIHIEPIQGAFIYLFLYDSSDDLQVLFPERFDLFDGRSYEKSLYLVPDGDGWFTLDGTKGTERFYLIASSERLRALESLVVAYRNAAAADKGTARQAVLDEIARVRRLHSQLVAAAEKPVTIAGGTRGINATIQEFATRIEAPGFYYRLFRLQH